MKGYRFTTLGLKEMENRKVAKGNHSFVVIDLTSWWFGEVMNMLV